MQQNATKCNKMQQNATMASDPLTKTQKKIPAGAMASSP